MARTEENAPNTHAFDFSRLGNLNAFSKVGIPNKKSAVIANKVVIRESFETK